MNALTEKLLPFYFDGREAKLVRIRKLCMDADEIADVIRNAPILAPRDHIGAVAKKAGTTLTGDRKYRQKWIADNNDALHEVSGVISGEDAFSAFVDGLADELAYVLEDEVLGALGASDEEGEEDGEGDGEDEGEE